MTSFHSNSDNNVQFVKDIKVVGICLPAGCMPGVEFKFDIYDDLKTFYSTRDISTFPSVDLSSYDDKDSLIDRGSFQSVLLNANQPNQI